MQVHRAHKSHLSQINALLTNASLLPIDVSCLNKRDIAIVVVDNNNVIGFMWCGLMAKKTRGYIDHFVVHPSFAGQKVGNMLCNRLITICQKLKVKLIFGIVQQNDYHNNSLMNAVRISMDALPSAHTVVYKVFEPIIGDK